MTAELAMIGFSGEAIQNIGDEQPIAVLSTHSSQLLARHGASSAARGSGPTEPAESTRFEMAVPRGPASFG
jgi:hypothetical protein